MSATQKTMRKLADHFNFVSINPCFASSAYNQEIQPHYCNFATQHRKGGVMFSSYSQIFIAFQTTWCKKIKQPTKLWGKCSLLHLCLQIFMIYFHYLLTSPSYYK